MLKKNDFLIALFIVAAAGLLFLAFGRAGPSAAYARITLDGREYKTVSLGREQTIVIERDGLRAVIEVKGGKIAMTESSCPDKLCVRQGAISQSGQTIVCLPNRIVIETFSPAPDGKVDIVAG